MFVRPVWRKKLNYCNTSNEVDVNLSTPMPKPQSPLKESSQENPPTTFSNHDSLQPHSLLLGDSCDTNVGQAFIPPQSVNQTQHTQPLFPHLLINPHIASVLHAQTPPSPQDDNQTQPPLPPSLITTSRNVVPTGRVKVPAGRYVVPTGKDNVIVSAGRTKVIPAGRTILVLKEEYKTWAMKMEYWIINSDHNLWNIVLNGNSRKKTGRDPKGNIMILRPVSVEEQIAVQRETKARTILLQSLPEDHMADFHHLDDARDIWLAVKARFGGNDESKKMRKSMLKQEFSEFQVSESEDCNMKFLRALPPSWSQVAITLKRKGGIDYLSFDDMYNKLRTLEIDVKGGSSYDSRGTSAPTHSAFVSAASTNSKMTYPDQSHSTTFTTASSIPAASSNVIESVLHSFVAESDPQQQITYEDFDQIGKMDLEELDIKWQMAMLSVRINRFEKKAGRKMKFNNKDAARFDKGKV
ncbi:hypothetical protein Tco_1001780, partial [Tanacetum coccineum]